MSEVNLQTFPSSKFEALALLYVQSQDLSGKCPKEILDMYDNALAEIRTYNREKHDKKYQDYSF